MSNAAIAYLNLADAGTVRASSGAPLLPPRNLQNPHVARKWRGVAGAAEYVVADLGAVLPVDTIMVRALNLTAAGTTRVRLSTVDTAGLAADAYDGGAVVGAVDSAYGYLIALLPAPVSARFVRVDMTEPGAAYIEAGRLFAGTRTAFAFNFDWGWGRQWVDPSKKTKSRGGQTHIDVQDSYRTLDLNFQNIPAAQRYGLVETIDRVNGAHEDVLVLTDPSSPNLGRDSVWGLISDTTGVAEPYFADVGAFTKSYKIEERL